ncbi:UNVERIFIED_CONTAM: hypothetical protein Slati_1471300 [Sesamum latifolium]|uniref:DUF4218 domain-containing protein n=1 Tax=Sesamum latifolium TaxID=2727402 RepID=A0AAW2X4V1_9LAMI
MLLIRHNLDVMHIEKNVFDNIFNTAMDIKGKTKDNLNARLDLKSICNRSELELDERRPNVIPKTAYTLTKEQKMRVCEWIKGLKFPDGYASNLARCVDMTELRMHGMKSHDCDVFMQKLIPIAFREMLFEHIFPPTFFDSMEHLIVHLPYEARVGGPVQYRWMYSFERASGAPMKRWLTGPERHIIKTYILTNCEVVTSYYESYLKSCTSTTIRETQLLIDLYRLDSRIGSNDVTENELLKLHYWGLNAEVTSIPYYFVNGYNFQTERHNTGKSTMNCVVPVPVVGTDNQTYNLRDPNGLQVMIDNQAAGTSQSQVRQTDDDNEDDDEDSFEDNETDDDDHELT